MRIPAFPVWSCKVLMILWSKLEIFIIVMVFNKNIILSIVFILLTIPTWAQLQLGFEVRPRTEYRHGFGTLANIDQEPAFFTTQRTRMNGFFVNDNITMKVTLQDIRVWGNQPQLVIGDGNLTSLHEGWGKFKLNSKLALKVGRQEIAYDDERIFGAVAWAQQARSHDAALLIFQDSTFTGHLGLAYNQNTAGLESTLYTVNNYKALQFLWLNKKWEQANLSFLFLNNGRQVFDEDGTGNGTNFSQTIGSRFGLKLESLLLNTAFYYQGGEQADLASTPISAYYAGLDLTYPISEVHKLTVGGEILSGNSQMESSGKNKAFTPFYGTNHKFNGLMDYFYVGNHINNVGLNDYFVKWGMKKNKLTTGIQIHYFAANGAVADELTGEKMSSYLGTEIDFTTSFPLGKGVGLAAGYSHMFASKSMVSIKDRGATQATNNWIWTMITIKPSFKVSGKTLIN